MRTSLSLIALAVGSFAAMPCLASTIDLTINGNASVGSNGTGAAFIDFGQYPNATSYAAAPGYGTFQVGTPVGGIFATAGITPGDTGQIESLQENVTPVQPFISFNGAGSGLSLDISAVLPGATAGPFTITDGPNGATASFAVDGTVMSSMTPPNGDHWTGTFAATFNGKTVADLLNMAAAGQSINTGFTGTFSTAAVSAVPEPATLALLGLGLLGLGIFTRKRVVRS